MTKNLLCIGFSLLTINAAFAQFPAAGSKGFAFGFNGALGLNFAAGHTGTLLYKYYKTDSFVWRFSTALTYSNSGSNSNSSGRISENDYSNYSIALGFGFEKVLAKVNRFAVYAGADIVPSIGASTTSSTTTINDSTLTGTGNNGDFSKTTYQRPAIFSLGLYPLLGFNYFISKNFSIGAEFSLGISYSFPGTSSQVSTHRTNGIDYPSVSMLSNQNATFNFSSTNSAVITGSVYF